MKKIAILVGLGNYYQFSKNGYYRLGFVEENIPKMMSFLAGRGWEVQMPLRNELASKTNIIMRLKEALVSVGEDGHVLFFYSGHAAKPVNGTAGSTEIRLMTSSPLLGQGLPIPFDEFYNERDYKAFAKLCKVQLSKGHLITILDCCYAYGLLDEFGFDMDNHSIVAASSSTSSAQFLEESIFFSAFSKMWDVSIDKITPAIDNLYLNDKRKPFRSYVIKPAVNFPNYIL
ncbi:hypothetical protein ACTJKN_25725 [Pedobacter sp. 22163]|uniref:hypothetical protein n=1 Tax=Pedobacter sp. 22163 TaxID=3453883 RepID=UPI003F8399E2